METGRDASPRRPKLSDAAAGSVDAVEAGSAAPPLAVAADAPDPSRPEPAFGGDQAVSAETGEVAARRALNIRQFCAQTIAEAREFLSRLQLTSQQRQIAAEIVREIGARLGFLSEVGLDYLTLDRESGTLSGGESQRIRLAAQIGSGLAGVLYVLDEPSIGLHQRDTSRLIATVHRLRDLGNTVIVVEHDEDTIRAADHLIDIGPGAGPRGGRLVAQGTVAEVETVENSPTGQYLSGRMTISVPRRRTEPNGWLSVLGARENNLQKLDVRFPLGCFTCVTGVSGSGKSTLVDDILRRALARHFYRAKDVPGKHAGLDGLDDIDHVITIDQSPIGRSPRSNPATYSGAFAPIRELFAQLPAARVRGYDAGRFSFNVRGGRCEHCQGDGMIKIEMQFLADVYVPCEVCEGRRYNRETLEITFKGKNVADVLEMSIEEAAQFFRAVPAVSDRLDALHAVGLGYLKLGQSSDTLSGGEAQRVKLAAELAKKATGRTLYLFDEPTTGLHFVDIAKLLEVFYKLRDGGNTLIVVEHNLDVIKCADWVIDLGPEGGAGGGRLVGAGPPEAIAALPASHTGRHLTKKLLPR
ncbi:MAG: excinuclease ABC subunit UvrA [Verrucomicrobia bacterium]|nr:excinuclease ABC subunit UvrA [Verrucomicrobiota bacterium]